MNGRNAFVNRFIANQPKHKRVELTKKNSFQILPFKLIAGFITSTANGIVSNDTSYIADYSTFQRVFTGLENMLALWEDAYLVQKEKEDDTFLTKQVNFGRSFRGMVNSTTSGAVFEPSPIDNDFLQQFTQEEFRVFTYEDLKEEDLFKLYLIPEIKNEKWLYISSATKYYNTAKEFEHTEIVFTTLNETLAKSGGAVEQFIHRSAPGEGYVWPEINQDGELIYSLNKIKDRPVTSIQDEFSGPAAFNTIFAYGRPVEQSNENGIIENKFNEKIESPRLLLPYSLETPITSPLNTRPTAEANWYTGLFIPTLWDNYDDWKKQFDASYDMTMRNEYEGVLEYNEADVKASNPETDGTHAHILWDSSWKPHTTKKYDCRTNARVVDELDLNGDYSITEMFAHNIFGTSYLEAIPLQITQNITWRLSDVPLIGGFLEKLTFGVPIGWNNQAIRLKAENIWLMIPASIAEFGNVLMGKPNNKGLTPLEVFTGKGQGEQFEVSGVNDTGSVIKVSLTDLFTIVKGGKTYTFNTLHLGQKRPTKDENGQDVTFTDEYLLWDNTCKPAPRKVAGYVIDAATNKTLSKTNYRRTFFVENYQDWTGTYKSQSSFTNSIRDWNNTIKMSKWESLSLTPVHYPEVIVDPTPPTTNYPVIAIPQLELSAQAYQVPLGEIDADDNRLLPEIFNYEPQHMGSRNGGTTSKTYSISWDTTPYGGLTVFLQNYKSIKINFYKTLTQSNTPMEVDISQFTSSEIALTSISLPRQQYRYRVWNDTGSSVNINTDKPFVDRLLTSTINTYPKLIKDGNNIKLEITITSTWTWNQDWRIFYYQNYKDDMAIINDAVYSNQYETISSNQVYANPKPII